jgi:predicted O-methyltransferase YrrM|tara:strand:+ start:1332 stop:1886 length:555 start_codon:yes stop_codon:yes gene_type:complete
MKPIYLRNIPPPAETFNHIYFLEFMASWIKPEHYLELGVRSGVSLLKIAPYCNKVTGVDVASPQFEVPANTKIYTTTTDDYFDNINNSYMFDMVFIDADHSYEQSLKDFNNVKNYVIEEGFIFLHDTSPYCKEFTSPKFCDDAYKTALHIKQNYIDEWEIVTLPFNPGLSILKKINRNKQILWK